jgi:hypothetical protein
VVSHPILVRKALKKFFRSMGLSVIIFDVHKHSKRSLKKRPAAEVRLQEQKRVKTECRNKHANGEFVITKDNTFAYNGNVTP